MAWAGGWLGRWLGGWIGAGSSESAPGRLSSTVAGRTSTVAAGLTSRTVSSPGVGAVGPRLAVSVPTRVLARVASRLYLTVNAGRLATVAGMTATNPARLRPVASGVNATATVAPRRSST